MTNNYFTIKKHINVFTIIGCLWLLWLGLIEFVCGNDVAYFLLFLTGFVLFLIIALLLICLLVARVKLINAENKNTAEKYQKNYEFILKHIQYPVDIVLGIVFWPLVLIWIIYVAIRSFFHALLGAKDKK